MTVASQVAGKTDLVLEGGGVKGLGLVGATLALAEAGYEFRRVAGASAGAIVATLVAALKARGRPMSQLQDMLATIDDRKFESGGKLTGKIGGALRLLEHQGLYTGNYLVDWLGGQLAELGVETFGQLAISDGLLPPERRRCMPRA